MWGREELMRRAIVTGGTRGIGYAIARAIVTDYEAAGAGTR